MTNDPALTVNRFCADVINAHNPAAADDLVAKDFTDLDPLPGQQPGRTGTHSKAFLGIAPSHRSGGPNW